MVCLMNLGVLLLPLTYTKDSYIRKMLMTSAHFGLANLRDQWGRTALFILCDVNRLRDDGFYPRDGIRSIVCLLDKGSNILTTDDRGWTCVHQFFRYYRDVSNREECQRIPKLLIDRGADIYAIDGLGRSVSDVAYSETCYDFRDKLGTYRGDIWDVVLDSCGYNIYDFRKTYPRKAKYDERYSRQDFELLWKDREHRCPYWDDAEWPCPENYAYGQHSDRRREITHDG